ncbi:unnamed protein product [Allacma fusca]|uniref:Cytochrome P450 n=1 Tax=Allacma fusca TaxID=39272 RepID=A0A8J2K7G6_9HEXA|nr:unnamed protein product [Allacma fusca]
MISLTAFLLSSVICFSIYYLFFKNDGKNYPKGPIGLPIFGNVFQLKGGQYKQISKWAKEYGPIYQIKLGQKRSGKARVKGLGGMWAEGTALLASTGLRGDARNPFFSYL